MTKKLAPRYKFGSYDYEDMIQEATIIAMEALPRYDGRVPLENFLSVHINNRLKNLKRDKYYRPFELCCEKCDCPKCSKKTKQRNSKKNIIEAIDIGGVKDESESRMRYESDLLEDIYIREIQDLIDQSLAPELREDYLKYKAGVTLPTARKRNIELAILSIIL